MAPYDLRCETKKNGWEARYTKDMSEGFEKQACVL